MEETNQYQSVKTIYQIRDELNRDISSTIRIQSRLFQNDQEDKYSDSVRCETD